MLLTKASEYALLSLIVIAEHDTPRDADTLSKELNLSRSFLAKILQELTRDEILLSFKGAKGGFKLARPSNEISLKDVLRSAEKKPTLVFECSLLDKCPRNNKDFCKVSPFFSKFQTKIDEFLDTMTLDDLRN